MAQFALYNYQFFELPMSEIRDKGQLYGAGAEPEVMAFKDSFPQRQEILGRLLEEDFESGAQKIKFKGERQTGYGHLHVMKPTDDIIILKVISKHSVPLHDRNLKGRREEDYRACIVVIDNRTGIQRIAIERNRAAFTELKQVEKILTYTFSRMLRSYCMRLELENLHSANDFWQYVNNTERYPSGFWKLRITLPPLNLERLTRVHNNITKRYRESFQTGMTIEFSARGAAVNLSEEDGLQKETIRWLTEEVGGNTTTLYPRGKGKKAIVVGENSYRYVDMATSIFDTLTEASSNQQMFANSDALDTVKATMKTNIQDVL
ncbi:MAG: hypothetical protein IJ142_00860 [Bacteroidaceae bacterium]|nr:hypothetical protein [Bacteroidaceae bacterium]